MEGHYDYIAVGGGSGGIASAVRAASYGAKVAVIEHGRLGGTCVNVGCVPKKVMWYAAALAHGIEDARDYGFHVEREGFDWGALKRSRDAYVSRLNDLYRRRLESSGIDEIRGTARFVGPRTLEVDGRRLTAEHVVVATGGAPVVPGIPGAELGITSDGFFELEACPERVVVIGGGYIAVELAGMFRGLGAGVTMLVRGEAVLRGFDDLMRTTLEECMRADGIDLRTEAPVRAVRRAGDGRLRVEYGDDGAVDGVDTLLWATGRRPNTDSLDLAVTGVERAADGSVPVDDYQATSAPGVYAIGDVTRRFELTPVAIAAGRRLSDRLFGGHADRRLVYECVPTVVFSHPPIGTVGLTEAEARAAHGDDVETFTARFNAMYYAFSDDPRPTAMKLVTVGAEQRIVGCHAIGVGADEMMQGFAVAVRMGARKRDFDDTVAIHPTSAEELVTLR